MSQDLLPKVDRGEFQEVFIEDLNWLAPDVKQSVGVTDAEGRVISARNVASYKGLRVWVCDERPGSALEAELDRLIAKTTTDRLVIFDGEKEQVWRWPVRSAKDGSVTSRLTSHRHKKGDADPKFSARLDIIRMPFDVVLDANAVLGKVRDAFDTEVQNESKRASKLMANMYAAVEAAYPKAADAKRRDHEISVTLARILFLMFGDDTDMWQTDAFRNVIQHETRPDGSDLAHVLNDLFTFLDKPTPEQVPDGFEGFKYVNGGIFGETIDLPPLGKDFRSAILDACAVDWSGISPAIFGSMFQSVRDAETRRALGEHYTSEENILKTLNPLFLDELRDDLAAALARDTTQKKVNSLNKLWDRLGAIRFMDPACGCGNFIIVAYRELRAIELQVMEALYDLRDKHQLSLDAKADLKVTLDHFYGIEIDEWPARIAETAMFMMDRQCDLKLQERFGQAPERLPIQREAKIVVGNALLLDWRTVLEPTDDVIVAGNPPFLGDSSRTREQLAELQTAWGGNKTLSRMDYVTGWHGQALRYLDCHSARWAFVTTNSVTQGDPVPRLFGEIYRAGWQIAFAHRTFPWKSEAAGAAAVHCVIIGFMRSLQRPPRLWTYAQDVSLPTVSSAANINAYLFDAPNVLIDKRTRPLHPGLPSTAKGSEPADGGHLLVSRQELTTLQSDPVARQFIRPFRGARELLHNEERWCLWMVGERHDELLAGSHLLRSRIEAVRAVRSASRSPIVRESAATPHLFRIIKQPHVSYVCIPRHVSVSRRYFPVARFGPDVICGDANFFAPDPDGYLFALISSSMFLAWQEAVGGRIKSDLRFGSTLTWNTLPLPPIDHDVRSRIIDAGAKVQYARGLFADSSLADLYAPGRVPPSLTEAHLVLDAVVDEAFGMNHGNATLEARARLLFENYARLTGASSASGPGELFGPDYSPEHHRGRHS